MKAFVFSVFFNTSLHSKRKQTPNQVSACIDRRLISARLMLYGKISLLVFVDFTGMIKNPTQSISKYHEIVN